MTHEQHHRLFRYLYASPAPRYIAIEGPDGVGKSTATRALAKLLAATAEYVNQDIANHTEKRAKVVTVSEPGTTHYAKALRKLILHESGEEVSKTAIALTFLAARADTVAHVEQKIADNCLVLTDRCWLSTDVYQHLEGVDVEKLDQVHKSLIGLKPHHVFLLDAPDASIDERIDARNEGKDRYEGVGREHTLKVRSHYRQYADHPDVTVVAAAGTIDQTAGVIRDLLLQEASNG